MSRQARLRTSYFAARPVTGRDRACRKDTIANDFDVDHRQAGVSEAGLNWIRHGVVSRDRSTRMAWPWCASNHLAMTIARCRHDNELLPRCSDSQVRRTQWRRESGWSLDLQHCSTAMVPDLVSIGRHGRSGEPMKIGQTRCVSWRLDLRTYCPRQWQ